MESFRKYFVNCFVLTIPVLAWNAVLAGRLPQAFQPGTFWEEIPPLIRYGEHVFRVLFFILIFMMPLDRIVLNKAGRGWLLYGIGLAAYFTCWLLLICRPESDWSHSLPGFTAPAWTPALWMPGITLIGRSFSFGVPFRRWIVLSVCFLFLLFHNVHTYMVFLRVHE